MYTAVRSIGDAGIDYIELWGEIPHAYHEWVDKKKLKDALSSYDMTVTLHAPFTDLNPATPYEPVKGAVQKALADFVRFGIDLGGVMITVHPGSVHSRKMVAQMQHDSAALMRALVKESEGALTISIENQTASKSKYYIPLGVMPESVELMLADVVGSKFTLDTGHAYASGVSPQDLAERLGSKLAEVHLSDNRGESDDHLIPGEGTADLQGVLNKVAGRDILICLELDPYKYAEEQVLRAAVRAKENLAQGRIRS